MADQSAVVKEFLLESFENLSSISEEIMRLEKDPNDSELLNQVYRSIHTLKGSASFLGFKELQELTHATENILDHMREGNFKMDSTIADLLFESFDKCMEFLKNIENSGTEGSVNYQKIKENLISLTEKKLSGVSEKIFEQNDAVFSEEALSFPGDQELVAKSIESVSESNSSIEEEKELEPQAPVHTPPKGKPKVIKMNQQHSEENKDEENPQESKRNLVDSVVKVNVNLLDKIMNVVGELVLNRNQILQYANQHQNTELLRLTQQLNMITTELQGDIMTTRMQPIGSILTKFERLVRDVSKEHGKKINLKITGQDTELDKTLIEAIRDPLTHIIRNAADHGLESIEKRLQSGKSEAGTIFIKAYHESGQVTIEVSDDGSGIDTQRILAKALEKEILTEEQAKEMSQEAILNLIFHPGFSTAEKVTNISGRGVGMDVVKTNIEKVGGTVNTQSELGVGTTFKMKIPLTLAIIPALIVESKKEFFAIPQVNLVELVRVEESEKHLVEKIYDSYFLRLRGNLVPVFYINESLRLEEMKEEFCKYEKCIASEEGDSKVLANGHNIVILNSEGNTFGIIVDEILDTQEIVVKPLGKSFGELSFFAGATIMGDGRVALIIDANGFYHVINKEHQVKGQEKTEKEDVPFDQEITESLLFTLADKNEYSLPLAWVNRLEEFNRDQIEQTGSQSIVRYRNKPMPLLNLEKMLQLDANSSLDHSDKKTIDCIVVQVKGKDFGFVVDSIIDIARVQADVDGTVKDKDGILGTLYVESRTVTVLDIYEILKMTVYGAKLLKINENYEGKKLLIVEDSPMYRNMEEELFCELGFDVVTAVDGADALNKLKQKHFDLIVTDIEMPNLDGFELATNVRSLEQYRTTPIIAVSTKYSEKDRAKGVESGFNKHLEKFRKEEIVKAVDQCLKEAS